ncbi:MAG: hypothetical protein JNK65_04635, partial [Deltaproteobacteria bacterium]|nr:hypothetical protein [Deltaproteobacteria bacterium]
APRLQKEIFDLDDQGRLMFFSKSQRQRPAKINPRTLEGMHLPFLQAHENFFGGHSRSVYFSWRHPEDFDLFPTHQPYQIDSLERFRSVNESGSNTEHLISQGRNFALGQHWVATLPFEFSSTLTSLPGARLAQHIERRVLEEAQSYRAPVQTLAALLSFISQKNLRSPVSPRIELDRNRIEFQGAIRARHEEIFARIEAYRLTHPNWNATQPLSLEETQRILQTGP